MKLSVKILIYNFFFQSFNAYVSKLGMALGVSLELIKALNDNWVNWTNAFLLYTDPLTNNDISASDMNGQYNICAPFVETIRMTIKNNILIKLTATDRKYLNIPIENQNRSKIPVTKVKPSVSSTGKSSLSINIFVFDPEFPTKIPKPPGAGSIGWKIAIMPVGVVPAPTDYMNQIPEKKSMFSRLFTLADVGKQFWMIAYYLSPTNEKGEDGEPFNTIII